MITERGLVILFYPDKWIWIIKVEYKDNIISGRVVNGAWNLNYDTITHELRCERGHVASPKILWIVHAGPGKSFTEVINNAQDRYDSGEVSEKEFSSAYS